MSWPEAVFSSVAILVGAPCAVVGFVAMIGDEGISDIIDSIRGRK